MTTTPDTRAHVERYRGYSRGYTTINVKNLGWLLRHASEAYALEAFRDRYLPGQDGPLEPNLLRVIGTHPVTGHVWTYWINFADWTVLESWIERRAFAHLDKREDVDGWHRWTINREES